MILDPAKMMASIGLSALILVIGAWVLSTSNPILNIAQNPFLLTAPEATSDETMPQSIAISTTENNQPQNVQITPENAIIEAEAMMASMMENNPINNSDWSLDEISDDALEMRR